MMQVAAGDFYLKGKEVKKNSRLAWSISHLVPKIFWFLKNANEIPYKRQLLH